MRANDLEKFLIYSFESNKNPVLIKGAPGIGKSDIVAQAAKKVRWDLFYKDFSGFMNPIISAKIASTVGAKLIISHPVVADPTDYKGLPFVVDGDALFLPFGELKELLEANSPTIYFLDDFGQASPAVQSAVMQLLLARRINGHRISDHVVFVAATNRREDRANVSGILEPVKSRFTGGIVELTLNNDDWINWAWKNGMPSQLISFIQFRPNQLFNFNPTRDIENSPSPRTVAGVGRMLNTNVPEEIRFEAIKGAAGESFAVEFEAYLKVFSTLPSIYQIESDPHGTLIPNEISAKFAVMNLCVNEMNQNNIGSLIAYLTRLGNEYLISSMKNATIKNPNLVGCVEFRNFAIKYGSLLTSMIN